MSALRIRRLNLGPDEAAGIPVAWVSPLEVQRVRQTCTCLGRDADGATWRYEDEAGSRSEAIRTDAEGFVTTYPGLFERVQP